MTRQKVIEGLLSRATAGGDRLWGISSKSGHGGYTTGKGWFRPDGKSCPDPDGFDLLTVEGDKSWVRVERG